MQKFLAGLLLGILATYWYMSDGAQVRAFVEDFWSRASSPTMARGHR